MDLGWILSIIGLAVGGGLFAFARWKAAKPAEPLKVRLFNYNIVAFIAVVIMLLSIAHMLTLATGKRFGGRQRSEAPSIAVFMA